MTILGMAQQVCLLLFFFLCSACSGARDSLLERVTEAGPSPVWYLHYWILGLCIKVCVSRLCSATIPPSLLVAKLRPLLSLDTAHEIDMDDTRSQWQVSRTKRQQAASRFCRFLEGDLQSDPPRD